MPALRLVPAQTKVGFLQYRSIAFVLSCILIVASVALFFTSGLNFGIDFRGGTLIEIGTPEPADLGQIRSVVGELGLGDVKVQEFGSPNDVLIVIEAQQNAAPSADDTEEDAENAQQDVADTVKNALNGAIGDDISYRRIEVVGPKVSGELVVSGTIAVLAALALMLFYIWIRFEFWQYSIGAVLALAHDVILTIGMFSVTQLEFNLSIIAAILTIVGYSMNDTVVVYDRVRETRRKFKRMELREVLDISLNATLSRTVMTSLTTLLALFSLYFLGGEVIRGFTFAMIWGVFVGTYSSIFVAAPLLLVMGLPTDAAPAKAKAGEATS